MTKYEIQIKKGAKASKASATSAIKLLQLDSASPEDILASLSIVSAGVSLIPVIGGVLASAMDVAIAFTQPICGTDAFRTWKKSLFSANDPESIEALLGELCSARVIGSLAAPNIPVAGSDFNLELVNTPNMCISFSWFAEKLISGDAKSPYDASVKISPCSLKSCANGGCFRFSNGQIFAAVKTDVYARNYVLRSDQWSSTSVVQNCLNQMDSATLNVIDCSAAVSQPVFSFLPTYGLDGSFLIRTGTSSGLCISGSQMNAPVSTVPCDYSDSSQWFKLRSL